MSMQHGPDDAPMIEVDWSKVPEEIIAIAVARTGEIKYLVRDIPSIVQLEKLGFFSDECFTGNILWLSGKHNCFSVHVNITLGTDDWERSLTWRPGHEPNRG